MPTKTDPFDQLRPAAKKVAEAQAKLDQARNHLRKAILAARAQGHTFQGIGDEIGLTAPRVHQIANED